MNRKLIKQAGQAFTVTLPVEWVRKNNLKQGDEVDLELRENEIIIRSHRAARGAKITINTTGFSTRMKLGFINSAYARGIDEIMLTTDENNYPDLNQNMGYAVISQRDNTFSIKDISGTSSQDLDQVFKRVFQMIMRFHDSAFDDIFGENKESYENIKKKDAEINRFALYLQRSVMKQTYPHAETGKIMFAYSFALEKLSDEVLRMWRTSIQKKIKKDAKIKEILSLSKKAIQKAFEIYYRANPELIKEIFKIRESVRQKSDKLKNIDSATREIILRAVKIAEDSYDLTHLSIMKNLLQ